MKKDKLRKIKLMYYLLVATSLDLTASDFVVDLFVGQNSILGGNAKW